MIDRAISIIDKVYYKEDDDSQIFIIDKIYTGDQQPINALKRKKMLLNLKTIFTFTEYAYIDLANLYLGSDGASIIESTLSYNSKLLLLNLKLTTIGSVGALFIANFLKKNNSIKFLCLEYNSIQNHGIEFIAEALKINKSLTRLTLEYNGIDDIGGISLAEALAINKSLKRINLSCNYLEKEGVVAIAKALKVNKYITNIQLASNCIGDYGAEALAKALKFNKFIVSINLKYNNIGNEGAIAFAEAIRDNVLLEVDLSQNEIEDKGAEAFAVALKFNKALVNLNLYQNKIGSHGVIAIFQALQYNDHLTHINLASNYCLGLGGLARAVANTIIVNQSLTHINLMHTHLQAYDLNLIMHAIRCNKFLIKASFSIPEKNKDICDYAISLINEHLSSSLDIRSESVKLLNKLLDKFIAMQKDKQYFMQHMKITNYPKEAIMYLKLCNKEKLKALKNLGYDLTQVKFNLEKFWDLSGFAKIGASKIKTSKKLPSLGALQVVFSYINGVSGFVTDDKKYAAIYNKVLRCKNNEMKDAEQSNSAEIKTVGEKGDNRLGDDKLSEQKTRSSTMEFSYEGSKMSGSANYAFKSLERMVMIYRN